MCREGRPYDKWYNMSVHPCLMCQERMQNASSPFPPMYILLKSNLILCTFFWDLALISKTTSNARASRASTRHHVHTKRPNSRCTPRVAKLDTLNSCEAWQTSLTNLSTMRACVFLFSARPARPRGALRPRGCSRGLHLRISTVRAPSLHISASCRPTAQRGKRGNGDFEITNSNEL